MMNEVADNLNIKMNHTNAQDHEPHSEWNIGTIEDAFRTTSHGTGCSVIPIQMIEALCELVTDRLNLFPAKTGILECCSPNTIVSKQPLDCEKHCQCSFGDHAQASQQNKPTNAMVECTIDAICVRPNDNEQGGC